MEHHPYGFSKWPALLVCPHYQSADKETDAAKAGTKNHNELSDYINQINTGIPAVSVNDNAVWAGDLIKSTASPIDPISSEERVQIPDGFPAAGVFGTCDANVIDSHAILHVFDYKSGAMSNIDYMPQVAGYALAIIANDKDGYINTDKIFCSVLYGADRKVVTREFNLSQLSALATRIEDNIKNKESLEPCANGFCRYCKHNKECKAMAGEIIRFKNNELTSMTDAKLYDWCVSAKAAIDTWIDDLKQRAKDNGGVLEDGDIRYELRTDKRGRVQTVDVPHLWCDMADKGCLVTQDQLIRSCTISKKAFTELYKADAESLGITVKDIEAKYAERCTFGEPASKLVKVDPKKGN